jgi:hypothetical protein
MTKTENTKKNGVPQYDFDCEGDVGQLNTTFIHRSKYDGVPETTIMHQTDAVCLKDILKSFETFLYASGFRWTEGKELGFYDTQ